MRSLHFGAGNIGRGFIGQLLHESGYDICFVDVREDVVEALKTKGRYDVVMAGGAGEHIPVDRVTALHSENEADEVTQRLAEADLITTAVGPSVLPVIEAAIAKGLLERTRLGGALVNVIACENMIGGSEALKGYVMEHVPDECAEAVEKIAGFPNAAVDRIVPGQNTTGIDVLVEPYFEWIVDASQIKEERPNVSGIKYVEGLGPYIERKLLTVNTGHSAIAYLGYVHGTPTIHAALEDDEVRETASKTLEETGLLLIKEYGFDPDGHREYRHKVLDRFGNPHILDEVKRVARAPIRKLGRNERFVSPALRLFDVGYAPVHLAEVIGAVLRYDGSGDEQAAKLQETIRAAGERSALAQYARIREDHPLVDLVVERLDRTRR